MFRKPAQFTFYFLLQNIVEIHCLRIIFIWNCMAEGSTIIFSVLTFVEKKIASKVRGSETQNCEGWTTIWLFSLPLGFPNGSAVKESACNVGDAGSIPGSGIAAGVESGSPFQYSCLKNPMDRRAWQATVQRVGHNLVTMHACYRKGILPELKKTTKF